MDKDYPKMPKKMENLEKSPKDLGISRADLWAFASLVALDELMQHTKSSCKYYEKDYTCGDKNAQCYAPLPNTYYTMFKTGRKDCVPKEGVLETQKYVASKIENHPNKVQNWTLLLLILLLKL